MISIDKENFSIEVEELAKHNASSYLDALLWISENRGLEAQTVSKLLTTRLKELIEDEAVKLNLVKGGKKARLPL